jgi:hypothetical protein
MAGAIIEFCGYREHPRRQRAPAVARQGSVTAGVGRKNPEVTTGTIMYTTFTPSKSHQVVRQPVRLYYYLLTWIPVV